MQGASDDHHDRLTHAWTTGSSTGADDQWYTDTTLGNLTSKAGVNYVYQVAGQPRPHAPTSVGGNAYGYDANGNLTSRPGWTLSWNADNLPTQVTVSPSTTEAYTYDADGERLSRTLNGSTTIVAGGVYEEDLATGTSRSQYAFGGQVVAQRTIASGVHTLHSLHSDHLGSIRTVHGSRHLARAPRSAILCPDWT